MTAATANPQTEADKADRAFFGHPKGLGYLSLVEGCERFSYYSMQTLLVLYMVKYLLLPEHIGNVVGLQFLQNTWYEGKEGQPLASALFGDYTALIYLTPILGGIVADRWLGRRTTLILGGLVMAFGHFLMAFEGAFLFALLALVVGVGLFKGNIATQVGELYDPKDLRRAMAFQLFYIAINLSVIASPLISGTLGEGLGWHYGFGSAGVVMVIGLIIYIYAKPWLPADNRSSKSAVQEKQKLTKADAPRLLVLAFLIPVISISILVNQEIFNAYLVWADEHFQLTFNGRTFPTSWMITLDAATSFSMLVAVAAFWKWYSSKTGSEPDELGKMILGSVFTVAGAMCLVTAAATQGDGKIGLFWPFMFHVLNSIGFAHILPVSLALFTKVAPKALSATVVGLYYLAFFGANKIVGTVGGWYSTMDTVQFWLLHAGAAAVGLVAFTTLKLTMGRVLADPS